MELLTRTFRQLQRLLGPNVWFTAAMLALVVTLEIAGRQVTTDLHDALSALLLGFAGMLAFTRQRDRAPGWVGSVVALVERARAWIRRFGFEIGIDLRGTPPLPRKYPPAILALISLLTAWAVVLAFFAEGFPHNLRFVGSHVFYVGYLAGLMALWGAMIFAILLSIFIPVAMIHDQFVMYFDGPGRRPRQWEHLAVFGYFAVIGLSGILLPPWVPLLICVAALTVNLLTTVIPSNPDVKFLWRQGNNSSISAIPWGRWVMCEFTIVTLVIVNLALTASGGALLGEGTAAREIMPITSSLGMMMAWLAPGALCALVTQTVLGRTRDPARPCPPVLHIQGAVAPQQQRMLRQLFTSRGWQVRFAPAGPQPTDVCVALVTEPPAESPLVSTRWPLQVTSDVLGKPELLQRLVRRDEIQKRRRLVSGLERLFKTVARRQFRRGSGIWIAPHYWFVVGLSRDTHEDELDLNEGTILTGIIGPPYHRLFPRGARHHFYRMLRALQIDLIFVEDGVGFRRFCRVLRMMFEVYDMFGGRRKAHEVHFTGVPGTRVLIHEYQLDEPFRSETYPEPDYENLARARILHVFRDRGEQEEPLETPLDFTRTPVPSMAH